MTLLWDPTNCIRLKRTARGYTSLLTTSETFPDHHIIQAMNEMKAVLDDMAFGITCVALAL